MSNQNYITEMLELKDNNVKFKEKFYFKEKINGITHKIFEGYLTYQPDYCYNCGVVFDDDFEKHGFITSNIKLPDVSGYKTILRLHKQRYLCKHCHKAFTLKTNIVDRSCFISKNTKWKIANDLRKKISEKDIALNNNVSSNTVERIMDSYYSNKTLYKNYLPFVLSFDEFKSVKAADGAMSFHLCNGETGQTIDIVEDSKDGALPSKTIILMLEEMLPDLLELQRYVEALETDLYMAQQELDEAEHAYEELYDDYTRLDEEMEMMREEYEEED